MKKTACFIALPFILLAFAVTAEGQFYDEVTPQDKPAYYYFKDSPQRTWVSPDGRQKVKAKLSMIEVKGDSVLVNLEKGIFDTSKGGLHRLSMTDQKYVLKEVETKYGKELATDMKESAEKERLLAQREMQAQQRLWNAQRIPSQQTMQRSAERIGQERFTPPPQRSETKSVCSRCNGTRFVNEWCSMCKGSGRYKRGGVMDPLSEGNKMCNDCDGTGKRKCPQCGGRR